MIKRLALSAALLLAMATPSLAVEPSEVLDDPALETRARIVGKGLRCVVCQNQSIDDSNSDLARDMRILVRDRLVAGDSNQQVMDYMVSRYGDFVLLNPPFKAATYVLWLGPAVIAGSGLLAVIVFYRRRKAADTGETGGKPVIEDAAASPLSAEEQARLKTLLGSKEDT